MTAILTPEMFRFETGSKGITQPACAYCGEPLSGAPCILFRDVSTDPGRPLLFHPECARILAGSLNRDLWEIKAPGESTCDGG